VLKNHTSKKPVISPKGGNGWKACVEIFRGAIEHVVKDTQFVGKGAAKKGPDQGKKSPKGDVAPQKKGGKKDKSVNWTGIGKSWFFGS